MPNYPRPKSSIPKKSTRSSLHPNGAPGFTETLEGLKRNLSKLGMNLAGAAMGMAGNLTNALQNLKSSGEQGDENSEQAYQEALAMLRSSGSSTADSLLKELGEELGEEPVAEEETPREMRSSDAAVPDLEIDGGAEADEGTSPNYESSDMAGSDLERVEKADGPISGFPEVESAARETQIQGAMMEEKPPVRPEDSFHDDKVVCLECGKEFRQLTHTHLSTHGLKPDDYKGKYGIPIKTPLSAKAKVRASTEARD